MGGDRDCAGAGLGLGLWIAAFWLAIWLLGFPLATLATTFLYLRVSLGVPFPPGQLLAWLGLAGWTFRPAV